MAIGVSQCPVWYSYTYPIIHAVTILTDIISTRLDNMRVIETILIQTITVNILAVGKMTVRIVTVGIMTKTILL